MKLIIPAAACLGLLCVPAHASSPGAAHGATKHHKKTHGHAAKGEARHYETRPEVLAFVDDMVQRNDFSKQDLLNWFAQARYQPAVIQAILPPANPRVRSWQTYRARFVEPKRINAGLRFWSAHEDSLRRAEKQYGVPAEIIVAIIGVETIYGRNTGNFETFSALATLAFDYPPRAELFRRELEALLLLARDEKRSPLSYQGSFAGALGLPQFLPSSLRNWAVDFNGDHTVDLTQPDDAIGSVGRFLAEHGWESGAPILAPVLATPSDNGDIADLLVTGLTPQWLPADLRQRGIVLGAVAEQPAALIDLITPDQATEYRLGYRNFYVLTRYNRSSFYATAVADLAAALRDAASPTSQSSTQ
ncbi:MAG: lytic murein transglycosylase B [Rhodocyclaceae bacterium]|nr:MAG: lytic murein transglycosylase B [Rhodocyclaceae bacterium]